MLANCLRHSIRRRRLGASFKLSHRVLGLFGENRHFAIMKRKRRKKKHAQQKFKFPDRKSADGSTAEESRPQLVSHLSDILKPFTQGGFPQHKAKPNTFLEKMRLRLSGGQFRMLNEKLYTRSGEEAFRMFKDDPSAFQCYHAGYQEQMNRWPRQPIEAIIDWLKERSASLIVADFGCGDAQLARSVKNQVYSLDLVGLDASVITCNMAHTPLNTASVDVAVFCLSLMGTDYPNFIMEAHRVLKLKGWLLIAEVRSRFDPSNGGADPNSFVKALHGVGFSLINKDFTNRFFVMFQFLKQDNKPSNSYQGKWPNLKPCVYKRR